MAKKDNRSNRSNRSKRTRKTGRKKGDPEPGAKGPGRRDLFLSFFKGTGVLIRVKAVKAGGRKVTISGAVARSVRPKLTTFFETLPLDDAEIRFALDELSGWRIEHTAGISTGVEQRIRNFLVNEA